MSTFRAEQLKAIKSRIIDIFEQKIKEAEENKKKPPTVYSLYQEIQNKYDDLGISYSTFRNTLTRTQEGSADFYTVMALCYHWQIDTSFVFAPHTNENKRMPPISEMISTNEGSFIALNDPSYCGTFFGYMHSQNTNHKKHIIKFRLEIKPENGSSKATLFYYGLSGKNRIFHGEPMLAIKKNLAFIIFTMEDGSILIFHFGYKKYAESDMYFRRGFISTVSSATGNPMIQGFVLFSRELSSKKEKYVDGLLPLADSEFYISKKTYEALLAESDVLQSFDERLSFLFTSDVDTVYQVSEDQIYETLKKQSFSDMDKDAVNQALNLLKDRSITPTRLEYRNSPELASFAKYFLQQYPRKDEENN